MWALYQVSDCTGALVTKQTDEQFASTRKRTIEDTEDRIN
jgi:hypothetical protein